MLKTITDLINWSNTSQEEEWATWLEWQRNQPALHYEKSDVFQYYIKNNVNFQPPRYSCITSQYSKQYIYCFGDFACLLVNQHGGGNIVEYFSILLDIYDTCKGSGRRIVKGDPEGIKLMREVIRKKSIHPIKNHNFKQYNYDYGMIHAHTVAQYSLSTLLMRLASHYMSYLMIQGDYYAITLQICQKSYDKTIFGEILSNTNVVTKPIDIPIKSTSDSGRPLSWPIDPAGGIRCKTCSRVTENIWGKFESCLDCHLKRICSDCGMQAVIIGNDTLPKCYYHQTKK